MTCNNFDEHKKYYLEHKYIDLCEKYVVVNKWMKSIVYYLLDGYYYCHDTIVFNRNNPLETVIIHKIPDDAKLFNNMNEALKYSNELYGRIKNTDVDENYCLIMNGAVKYNNQLYDRIEDINDDIKPVISSMK